MSLSCSCDDDYEWYYEMPEEYSILNTKYRKRCVSCKELIEKGSTCLIFQCWRHPNSDVELKIYSHDEGAQVWLGDKYMCEVCGDLFYSLIDLGFCVSIGEDSMQYLVKEYNEIYHGASS